MTVNLMYNYQLSSLQWPSDSDMMAVNKYPLFFSFVSFECAHVHVNTQTHTNTHTHTHTQLKHYILVIHKLIHVEEVLKLTRLEY